MASVRQTDVIKYGGRAVVLYRYQVHEKIEAQSNFEEYMAVVPPLQLNNALPERDAENLDNVGRGLVDLQVFAIIKQSEEEAILAAKSFIDAGELASRL